jgi:hypothetical protein
MFLLYRQLALSLWYRQWLRVTMVLAFCSLCLYGTSSWLSMSLGHRQLAPCVSMVPAVGSVSLWYRQWLPVSMIPAFGSLCRYGTGSWLPMSNGTGSWLSVSLWYPLFNNNQAAWNFLSLELEVTWRTVAIIIRVVLVFTYLCIRGVSLSSIHYIQSRRVYINQRHQYIRLIWC